MVVTAMVSGGGDEGNDGYRGGDGRRWDITMIDILARGAGGDKGDARDRETWCQQVQWLEVELAIA